MTTSSSIRIFIAACALVASSSAFAQFCSHGTGIISEDIGTTTATRLFRGDFDGDGLPDLFCKDVRADDSNGNRLLEWLELGNGQRPFSAMWNEWCTHENSRITLARRGNRSILVCRDNMTGYWERELP